MLRPLHISRNTACRTLRALHSFSKAPIDVSPEVQHALQNSGPVVALETALVTSGLPHPINLQAALSIESKVRSVGAIPATIGVLDGRIKVGLTKTQLERLADAEANPDLVKISRRDLAAAVGLRRSGGTTISGTSVIANLVGIRIFATGGLGGVHRGGEISWDVSADLTELGRTPIAVVSAGIKSILDIPRSLEYMETQGVAVFTYGPTDEFPGFFGAATGCKSPWRVDSPCSAASIIHTGKCLGLNSGMLFAAPIPEEHAEMTGFIQGAVEQAIKESEENGMSKRGKEVTPWLLARVAELTQRKSIPSNIALLENTAIIGSVLIAPGTCVLPVDANPLGGKIAIEYAKLIKGENVTQDTVHTSRGRSQEAVIAKDYSTVASEPPGTLPPASLVVIGAAAVDITSQPEKVSFIKPTSTQQSTTPGQVSLSSGGVARNIAEAAHHILSTSAEPQSHAVLLISPLGNDLFANLMQDNARKLGMRTDGFLRGSDPGQRTAVCNMHLDTAGNLVSGVADMSIIHTIGGQPIIEMIEKHRPLMVAFDANLNPDTLLSLLSFCGKRHIPTFFEPTSIAKSGSVLPALRQMIDHSHFHSAPVTFASPNLLELSQIFQRVQASPDELTSKPHWWTVIDALSLGEEYRSDLALLSQQPVSTSTTSGRLSFLADGTAQMAVSLLPFFQHLFIKCGEKGVFVAMRVTGEAALTGAWSRERTRHGTRQIISRGKNSILVLKHYPAIVVRPEEIVNVTGAGDSLVGSLVADLIRPGALDSPESMDRTVDRAQRASTLSLCSADAVSSLLTDCRVGNTS